MPSELLIVFTRYPRPGEAKTRLAGVLGEKGAAALHRRLADHTLDEARKLARRRGTGLEVRATGGDCEAMRGWLGQDLRIRPQEGDDLGARLQRAFTDAFTSGATRVVIIGTDCPDLTGELLGRAFAALGSTDLVLGPVLDGGYYLIGLTCAAPKLFDGIAWGTDNVLAATRQAAAALGLSVTLLERLADIDRPEDLIRARAFLDGSEPRA